MKVKIGNTVYDAENTPIMLILEGNDKENIKKMDKKATKFVIFPDNCDIKTIDKWANES